MSTGMTHGEQHLAEARAKLAEAARLFEKHDVGDEPIKLNVQIAQAEALLAIGYLLHELVLVQAANL